MKPLLRLGNLEIGRDPLVVGVVSSPRTVDQLAHRNMIPCDVLELRLDLIGSDAPDWLGRATHFIELGKPVILTIRHTSEGGHWYRDEDERMTVYQNALPFVSAIDVEIRSTSMMALAHAAREQGKTVIGSFHDFEKTPPQHALLEVIDEGFNKGSDIVKLATLITSPSDVDNLQGLLVKRPDAHLSLMGMGAAGAESRVPLARAGSCLIYGFLDQSVAPGQFSCEELQKRLGRGDGAE